MSELDRNDLDTLKEALDAWVNKDDADNIMASLVESMIPKAQEGTAAPKVAEIKQRHEEDKMLRKDRAILLQAKLIQMRDGLIAEEVMSQ